MPGHFDVKSCDCEDTVARHMVGQALLAAQFVALAERVGMTPSEINAILKNENVVDLSADLKKISGLHAHFPQVAGRVDEAKHGGNGFDSRQPKHLGMTPRDMYEPDLHIDSLKIQARNFR